MWTVDEGAYLLQADWLANGEVRQPLGQVGFGGADGTLTAPPLDKSQIVGDDWMAYSRHIAYPALLALFDSVGPSGLLSAVSSFVFAMTVALAVERHRVSVLWLSALATPMVFHAHIQWAHAPATAAIGVAYLGLRRMMTSASIRTRDVVFVVVGLLAANVLRSESLLLGVAVCVVAAVDVVRRRDSRSLSLFSASLLGTAVGFATDLALRTVVQAGDVTASATIAPDAITMAERLLVPVRFLMAIGGGSGLTLLLRLAILCLAAVVGWMHGKGEGARSTQLLWPLGALAFVASLTANSPTNVGLLVASPIVVIGLASLGASGRFTESKFELSVAGLHLAAITAASYAPTAGADYGGRLLLVALPFIAAIALPVVGDVVAQQRLMLVPLAVLTLAPAAHVWQFIDRSHESSVAISLEVSDFAGENQGASFVAHDIRTGRVAWQAQPFPLATTAGLDLGEFLEGHDGGEVWLIGARISLERLSEDVPDGWRSGATYEGENVSAVRLER